LICPANPVTSIGPMLAIPGFARLLSNSGARVVALSPMVGGSPYSGPAAKLMRATKSGHDSAAVARLYSRFLDCLMISEEDEGMCSKIESLGVECVTGDTRIRNEDDELRLARKLLKA